jgi:hypothetical protein
MKGAPARTARRARRRLATAALAAPALALGVARLVETRTAAALAAAHPPAGALVDVGGDRLPLDCAGEGAPTTFWSRA